MAFATCSVHISVKFASNLDCIKSFSKSIFPTISRRCRSKGLAKIHSDRICASHNPKTLTKMQHFQPQTFISLLCHLSPTTGLNGL